MQITPKEIIHVANLARLTLSPEEVTAMTARIGQVLQYVEKLNELDTTGVEPTTHALALCNAFREDERVESLPQAEALANCAQHNDEAFVVPKVVETTK